MTKKQLEKKTRHLIAESAKCMRRNMKRAIESGAIDIKSYEDNYILPKIVLRALLEEENRQYSLTKEEEKLKNNLWLCM